MAILYRSQNNSSVSTRFKFSCISSHTAPSPLFELLPVLFCKEKLSLVSFHTATTSRQHRICCQNFNFVAGEQVKRKKIISILLIKIKLLSKKRSWKRDDRERTTEGAGSPSRTCSHSQLAIAKKKIFLGSYFRICWRYAKVTFWYNLNPMSMHFATMKGNGDARHVSKLSGKLIELGQVNLLIVSFVQPQFLFWARTVCPLSLCSFL